MRRSPWVLPTLILAGEAIFLLPFVVPRVFRGPLLDALSIDHSSLGRAFSVYGIVAMLSYALGGPLADRFPPRTMMATALATTALGGLVLATWPGPQGLTLLYGAWGASTILLFWAGLLRATRAWGGEQAQGRAYGLLDGGRGLVAAGVSTLAVALFAWLGGDGPDTTAAFRGVVLAASAATAATAVLVYVVVPADRVEGAPPWPLAHIGPLLRRPTLWLQGAIVVCAYVGYKGTDALSVLASDVLGYSEVQASTLGTLAFWLRPPAAVAAGFLADRIGGWKTVAGSFAVLLVADLGVAAGTVGPRAHLLLASIVGTAVCVYALRGVYFALLSEGGVPLHLTGTAVGVVSVVGYTPDVFFGPLMGWLLDRAPGAAGHRDLFLVLAGFAAAGLVASLAFGAARSPRLPDR